MIDFCFGSLYLCRTLRFSFGYVWVIYVVLFLCRSFGTSCHCLCLVSLFSTKYVVVLRFSYVVLISRYKSVTIYTKRDGHDVCIWDFEGNLVFFGIFIFYFFFVLYYIYRMSRFIIVRFWKLNVVSLFRILYFIDVL